MAGRRLPAHGSVRAGALTVVGGIAVLALAACSGGSPAAGGSPSTGPSLAFPTAATGTGAPSGSATASGSPSVTATPTKATATTAATTVGASGRAGLGIGANLGGWRPFPASNAWNTRVDGARVDPRSAQLIASIGAAEHLHPDFGANWDGGPFGIPYVVVAGTQARVPVTFEYADESDRGPYPIPANAPVEGGAGSDGDRHVLVVDRDHRKLYELYGAQRLANGSWRAGSGAVFDLSTGALRPAGWTSADAAGLPIFPGLVRYDEVTAGHIDHALRFTVNRSRRAYVAPARHQAGSATDPNLPPMGMRVRLKASYNISGYPREARVILQALKTYGMIVADNGSSWYLSGAPDTRWNDDRIGTLKQVPGSAFEVVAMGPVSTG